MTIQAKRVLAALDRKIDASLQTLTPEQLKLYRTLFMQYVAVVSSEVAPGITGADEDRPLPGLRHAEVHGVHQRGRDPRDLL